MAHLHGAVAAGRLLANITGNATNDEVSAGFIHRMRNRLHSTTVFSFSTVLDFFADKILESCLFVFVVILLIAFRKYWIPFFVACYEKLHCPTPRDNPCIGWCCARCCPCMVNQYHPPFRLRIAVNKAWHLRKVEMFGVMDAYVSIRCGNNPAKSTSPMPVPFDNSHSPVEWKEYIDLEVQISDDFITLQVVDQKQEMIGMSSAHVIGTATLVVSEFFPRMADTLDTAGGSYLSDTKQLLYNSDYAGEIDVELFATPPGKVLPAVIREVYCEDEVQEPLLNTFLSSLGFGSQGKNAREPDRRP
jgi:hypothetical protein